MLAVHIKPCVQLHDVEIVIVRGELALVSVAQLHFCLVDHFSYVLNDQPSSGDELGCPQPPPHGVLLESVGQGVLTVLDGAVGAMGADFADALVVGSGGVDAFDFGESEGWGGWGGVGWGGWRG